MTNECFLCGGEIGALDPYVSRSGVADGEMQTITMHPECEVGTDDWGTVDWEVCSPGELERPCGVEVEE